MAEPSASFNKVLSSFKTSDCKETLELSQAELKQVIDEIEQLQPMNVTLDIDYETDIEKPRKDNVQALQLTMVDQKVINALTETRSTMRSYICGATPKMFNDIDKLPSPTEENYKYGLFPTPQVDSML